MADVEVKLDIKAEAKAALAAVEALGRKLDELQAKSRLLVGGASDGSGGGQGAAPAPAAPAAVNADWGGQQAAAAAFVKVLGEVQTQVAAVGESLSKLVEQPSVPPEGAAQVGALAEGYKQLAAAMAEVAAAAVSMPQQAVAPEAAPVAAPVAPVEPVGDGTEQGLIGMEDIRDRLEEEMRAAEKLRQELEKLNKAHGSAGAAAGAAAGEEEESRYAMELAKMSAQELAREIERLTEARKQAAKAGDAAAMQRYGQQLSLANKEMQRSRREQTIMRAAWLQQAQGAREAAASIKNVASGFVNLGENAKNGQLDLVGLGMEVFSLAKAFKGLLGPVGLALVALELVTKAWNDYQQRKQAAAELAAEKLRKDAEDLKKAAEVYREAGAAYREQKVQEFARLEENLLANIRREAELGEERAAQQKQLLDAETAHREKMLRVQLQAAVGADKERLQEELKNIELAKAARMMGDAEAAESAARYALTLMERELENSDKFKDLLQIKLPDVEQLEQLEARLESSAYNIGETVTKAERREMQVQVASIHNEMRRIVDEVKGIDSNIHGSDKEVIEWVRSLQEARRSSEEVVEEQRKTWEATKNEAELAKKNYDWRVEEAAAEKKATEARRAAEEAAEERALEWERLKEQPLAEQVRRLKEMARSAGLSAKEQERIRKELASVQARQISEAMARLLRETQTTGTYQAADNRTRRQIMQADAALLTVRRKELEQLLRSANLDEKLRSQLEAELSKTQEQIAGLSEAWGQNRRESYKWLSELQPPQLKARNERVQKNLDAMAQGYARAAQRASEAAKEGDTDALRAARRSMQTYARAMSRMSADSGAARRLYDEHTEKLREVAQRTALSAAEERKAAAAAKRKAAAQNKAAAGAEQEAREREKNAAANGGQQDSAALAEGLRQELESVQGELQVLKGAVSGLSGAAVSGAAAARACAAAANEGLRGLSGSVEGLWKEVKKLQEFVKAIRQ